MLLMMTWRRLCLLALIATVTGQGLPGAPIPCDGVCPRITYQHYVAKGCEPVFDDSVSACCPARFDCNAAPVRAKDKCYYKGQAYNDGASVPVGNPCEANCYCSSRFTGSPRTECAIVECPSLFNPQLFKCNQRRSIDRCCAEILDCPPGILEGTGPSEPPAVTPVTRATHTCNVEGREYQDGQEIYPKSDPCKLCICNEQFTDIYGDQCREIECGLDYRDRDELDKGCTPIYFEGRCCPFEWMCPDDVRIIEAAASEKTDGEVSPVSYCSLGSIILPVNATLPTTSVKIVCRCETPPDFTCVQYSKDSGAATARESVGML